MTAASRVRAGDGAHGGGRRVRRRRETGQRDVRAVPHRVDWPGPVLPAGSTQTRSSRSCRCHPTTRPGSEGVLTLRLPDVLRASWVIVGVIGRGARGRARGGPRRGVERAQGTVDLIRPRAEAERLGPAAQNEKRPCRAVVGRRCRCWPSPRCSSRRSSRAGGRRRGSGACWRSRGVSRSRPSGRTSGAVPRSWRSDGGRAGRAAVLLEVELAPPGVDHLPRLQAPPAAAARVVQDGELGRSPSSPTRADRCSGARSPSRPSPSGGRRRRCRSRWST